MTPLSEENSLPPGGGKASVRTHIWTMREVAAVKAAVKAELDGVDSTGGKTARLRLERALERISALAGGDRTAQLHRFVYVVSALVAHERHGGLKGSQIRALSDLGRALLVAAGIPTQRSRLAFLHAELRLVLSQIARKSGRHFDAVWQQQLAFMIAKTGPVHAAGFQALGLANRLLRLGYAQMAGDLYEEVATNAGGGQGHAGALLGRIMAIRLTGHTEAARNLCLQVRTDADMDPRILTEITWQALCLNVPEAGGLEAMTKAVTRKGTHAETHYAVEALAWCLAAAERAPARRLPAVRSLLKTGRSKKGADFWLETVKTLATCHETDLPLPLRIERLGFALGRRERLLTVDKELLLLLAASRWLAKVKALRFAVITLLEYESLSLKLSAGGCRDILGIGGDLLSRPWFTRSVRAAAEGDDPPVLRLSS